MIIGNGLIANGFSSYKQDENTLIFASGVSNSKEKNQDAFSKERALLEYYRNENWRELGLKNDYLLVYFSTTSVLDQNQASADYVKHKLIMEQLVETFDKFIIFRLPQVVGVSSNPHTLINFLHTKISTNQSFDLWLNAKRSIIDITDTFKICKKIINNRESFNRAINIGNGINYSTEKIVQVLEKVTEKTAIFNKKELGSSFDCDVSYSLEVANSLGLEICQNYLELVLEKYYRS
jgi:nucleoside-diphosphate-sugar epimerase